MNNADQYSFDKKYFQGDLPGPYDAAMRSSNWDLWNQNVAPEFDPKPHDTTNSEGIFGVSELLDCIFGNSPFLSKIAIKYPNCVESVVQGHPDDMWTSLAQSLSSEISVEGSDISHVMKVLRTHKEQTALLVALCDLTGQWDLDQVTGHLSAFAEKSVQTALTALLRAEAKSGNLSLKDEENPMAECGIFVLALGKLGARELNYSSDIDLMVLFSPDSVPYTGKKSTQEFAIKLTKNLVKILDERTKDGYVFRTDLRLRPDPASTAVAVSTESAELYYESWGQNWERSALIKARCIAGDQALAEDFLASLVPFIWRKSLDFYAIQDIHSIKRQIYTAKGGEKINVLGHDIKTGRGGIREIEFFVQIQQLIWGGRIPELRVSRTLDALGYLTSNDLIEPSAQTELTDSYVFLRRLEHRLQMINDEQTQKIPEANEKVELLANFFGTKSFEAFSDIVTHHLRQVERHYANLFEDAPDLAIDGNLVFTGSDHDPDTLKTLEGMGYSNPEAVSQVIKTWHHGRYRATRSTRSRQILTELVPSLLTSFAKTAQPDRAFLNFDQSLQKLPAGVQLFSVFYANPEVLDLVAEIMGDAPVLADYLTGSTQRLDYVLDPVFFDPIPEEPQLVEDLQEKLKLCQSYEEILDACVSWTNDFRFRIGVQILRDIITPSRGSTALTTVTDVVINELIPVVCREFESQFGTIKGGALAILAYGKLGSKELMPSSDLDLVVIYDPQDAVESEGGNRSLPASAYFVRLAQRLVSALTIMTSEGRLFDVDLRLRPSGDQGPFASSIEAFEKYHASESWLWEHLAMTRARVVFATEDLGHRVQTAADQVLMRTRTTDEIKSAIAEMRTRIAKEFGNVSKSDIKKMPGGLMDAEFLVQFYTLSTCSQKDKTLPTNSSDIVEQLIRAGDIETNTGESLRKALRLWQDILWLLRLTVGDNSLPEEIPAGLIKRLLKITNTENLNEFRTVVEDTSRRVADIVDQEFGSTTAN